jgi:hypothetical protein
MAKKKPEEWEFKDYLQEYEVLRLERSDIDKEAIKVSTYILPGRGMFNNLTRPAKKKFTSPKVVNPCAREAQKVLTAGMQGWLTSPSRPWFKLSFRDWRIKSNRVLTMWLADSEKRMYDALSMSNFYQSIHSFYTEHCGFGTASMYVGEDGDEAPFRFELLTFGEFCIATNSKGMVDRFYRVIFRKGHQLIEDYENKLPESFLAKKNDKQWLNQWFSCLEATVPVKMGNKPFTKTLFLMEGEQNGSKADRSKGTVLEKSGYHEFPYPTARWDIIGTDTYGVGPGIEALPDVMRLQEMEKAASMAVHKDVSPPLFVPAHLKGKIKALPGGITYSRNTMNEKITSLYDKSFDYKGIMGFIERVEQRIGKIYCNDVFLTASRDPNASPLKATQVNVQEQEKTFRLGPVVERLHYEFLQQLLTRCFNIMLRKGKFQQLDPGMMQILHGANFDISLVSILAQAQKKVGAQPIQEFLQFVGAVGSIFPQAYDTVDVDTTITEFADITGVPVAMLVDPKKVQAVRQQRAQQQQQMQQAQMQAAQSQVQGQAITDKANAAKALSEAGVNVAGVLGGQGGGPNVQ